MRSDLTYTSEKEISQLPPFGWSTEASLSHASREARIKGSGQSFQLYHSTSAQFIYSPENQRFPEGPFDY